MEFDYIVVLITTPSIEVARQIAQTLLEKRLAACVNIITSLHSMYIWQGKLCEDEEVLLLVKTKPDIFRYHLIPTVHALHPYQTPEIIALPILFGDKFYLNWIDEVVQNISNSYGAVSDEAQ